MSDMSDLKCAACGGALERVRYFPRQMLTADEMRLEQEYFREKHRRHNRMLHGWGVVCGAAVEWVAGAKDWAVRVCPGFAVGPQGDDIQIDDCIDVDLKLGAVPEPCTVRWPCPPTGNMPGRISDGIATAYVAVRYAECQSRPMRVHPSGCGCDEALCEYSRIRESFEIKVLWELPQSHVRAMADDEKWCATIQQLPADVTRTHRFPVPPCPQCESEPWVVLATVRFPAGTKPAAERTRPDGSVDPNWPDPQWIRYNDRRTLLSTQGLQVALACKP
ncbi:hypothetical protein ACVNIS_09210 [Sphaerotilaceae bacterium SBD11-9]